MNRLKVLVSAATVLLAGCASLPRSGQPVRQLDEAVVNSDQSVTIDEQWWRMFGDERLNQLIDRGLRQNPSLDAALARLRAAQAIIGEVRSQQLPQVNGDVQAVGQRLSDKALIPPPYAGTSRVLASTQASLSWDLDIFGRQQARVDEATASARSMFFDAAASRLAVSSAIAQAYVGLKQAHRQIEVADAFVAKRREALAYTRVRLASRLSSSFERESAETLLSQAEQARIRAQRQRELMLHALAALLGEGASFYGSEPTPTLRLEQAPEVPNYLPFDLLGRRPDVLAAQARIQAALQNRRAVRAEFFPNINLQGLVGLSSIGLGDLLTGGAATYGGGGAIHVPLFEGGRLRSRYKAASANLDDAISTYNAIVLQAVRDGSDQLTLVRSIDEDLSAQARIVKGLQETLRLDDVRTATGLGSRLDAVESGFRVLEAEQSLIDLQAEALSRRVRLVAALGGGFDPTQPDDHLERRTSNHE